MRKIKSWWWCRWPDFLSLKSINPKSFRLIQKSLEYTLRSRDCICRNCKKYVLYTRQWEYLHIVTYNFWIIYSEVIHGEHIGIGKATICLPSWTAINILHSANKLLFLEWFMHWLPACMTVWDQVQPWLMPWFHSI